VYRPLITVIDSIFFFLAADHLRWEQKRARKKQNTHTTKDNRAVTNKQTNKQTKIEQIRFIFFLSLVLQKKETRRVHRKEKNYA